MRARAQARRLARQEQGQGTPTHNPGVIADARARAQARRAAALAGAQVRGELRGRSAPGVGARVRTPSGRRTF